MTRMEAERIRQGMSRAGVARAAAMSPTMYGWCECRRYIPYAKQLERIATAVRFGGDPASLLEEVPHAQH